MQTTVERPTPRLEVVQPANGFRYGAEAFWLAGFGLEGGEVSTAIDLGTGSGIVALLLAGAGVQTLGIDLRAEWEPLWARSLAGSGDLPVTLRRIDVRDLEVPPVDLVVSNPPFFALGSGPMPDDAWRAAARFETTADLADFLEAGERLLRPGGRLCVVLPMGRAIEALARAPEALAPQQRIQVGRRRVLLAWRKGGEGALESLAVPDRGEAVKGWYRRVGAV